MYKQRSHTRSAQLSEAELETSIMRPRKFDHFKGFNFYVVEDEPEGSARKADGDTAELEGEKNGLDQWFEVRKNVLPPDEADERNRENPTWKVSLGALILPDETLTRCRLVQTVKMPRIRDYEISKRDEPNEIVLTFFDGSDPVDPVAAYEAAKKKKRNGAAEANVEVIKDEEEDEDEDDLFGDQELEQEANGDKDPVSMQMDAVKEPLSTMTKRKEKGVYYGKIVSRVHVRKRRMMVGRHFTFPPLPNTTPLAARKRRLGRRRPMGQHRPRVRRHQLAQTRSL